MGISAQQHRVCVGLHNLCSIKCEVKKPRVWDILKDCFVSSGSGVFVSMFIIFYSYLLLSMILMVLSHNNYQTDFMLSAKCNIIIHGELFNPQSMQCMYNMYILIFVLKSSKCGNVPLMINWTINRARQLCGWLAAFDFKSLFIYCLNKCLVVKCNPSLLNPGPPFRGRPLSVFYKNIQGFVHFRTLAHEAPSFYDLKMKQLHGYLYTNKPDVVILNETWLKKYLRDSEILPDKYKIFRIDRTMDTHPYDPANPKKFRKNGGGVLIAHRDDIGISSTQVKLVSPKAELLTVILKMPNSGKNFAFSTFYRTGSLRFDNFQEFSNYFETLSVKKKLSKHILIGDFNLSDVTWPQGETSNVLYKKFLDFCQEDLNHEQLIHEPTHKDGGVLDLLFTNIPEVVDNVKILELNQVCTSDHFGITFDINVNVRPKKSPKRSVFNYSKANWPDLNHSVKRMNWEHALNSPVIDTSWNAFKSIIDRESCTYIPKKTLKSQFQPPWFDSNCERILKEKDKWRRKYKESNSESDREKVRSLNKEFRKTMNNNLRLNLEDDCDPALISKKYWSHLKSKTKSTRIPESVYYGSRLRNTPQDQANLFNEYFASQFSEPSNYNIDIDMSSTNRLNGLRFHPLDVYLILKDIKPGKAAGPDGIHGALLKNCASSLAVPLSILFNRSYATGCIPAEWKLASVVPVHKKGDKGSVENYRPISLTCLIMKVFERCIRSELLSLCEEHLDPRQHGFVNGRSCTSQMVPFVDSLAVAINEKSKMDIIYFDFAKAFDTVSHDIILKKLKTQFGVDGMMLRFLKSYLQDRQQQVVIGGETSTKVPVNSGVPQGSILGPLLFVIFINDMFSCVSEGTHIALYADDTKIWREICWSEDHTILQNDINSLLAWSIENRMRFHPSKCKALSVTHKVNVLDNLPFNVFWYRLGDIDIEYVHSHTDLGVIMTSNLHWGRQCKDIAKKASDRLGLLIRTCGTISSQRQRIALYKSLIASLFEHCSVIWSPQYESALVPFESVQKRGVKFIAGHQRFDHYSADTFLAKQREYRILPIRLRFILRDIVMFYKIVNSLVPITLPDYISPTEADQVRYTRRTAAIIEHTDVSTFNCSIIPTCDSFRKSFFYRTLQLWNRLPLDVRQSSSISAFKASIIEMLWSVDIRWPD